MNESITKKIIWRSILLNISIPIIGLIILVFLMPIADYYKNNFTSKVLAFSSAISVLMAIRGIIITGFLFFNLYKSKRGERGRLFFLNPLRRFKFIKDENAGLKKIFFIKRFIVYIISPFALGLFFVWFKNIYRTEINPTLAYSDPPFENWISVSLVALYIITFLFLLVMIIDLIYELSIAPKISKPKFVKPKIEKPSKEKSKISKKLSIGICILFLFLLFTNPSTKSFKEYKGYNTYTGLKRTQNWLIFSIYMDGHRQYMGVALNFFPLRNK